jgi:hypothetical protein
MPRVKRRGHELRNALTDAQRETLLYGYPILDHSPDEEFTTEEAVRIAWRKYRVELIAELDGTGERPWGFYRFDLKMTKPPTTQEEHIATLRDRRLLGADELRRQPERTTDR